VGNKLNHSFEEPHQRSLFRIQHTNQYAMPILNPRNDSMFSKINSLLDGELIRLRNESKNQQKLFRNALEHLRWDARSAQVDAYEAQSQFEVAKVGHRANELESLTQ